MSGGGGGERQGGTGGKGERVAKVIARAGVCSRRDAERLIAEGRVLLNGRKLATPAVTVGPRDRIVVDGEPLKPRERTRLWLFHKPKGLVTTSRDPEGRPTVFSALPKDMPRVLSVGRLDINTEGLLLLTNDGGLARLLELPSTGWLRRYRVRAHGKVEQPALDALRHGVTIDGMVYGAIEAEIDRVQGSNVWLLVGLREGKNREVKRVLEHLGLSVSRLIRVSYGPFQLGDLEPGEVREVRGRVLRDQLGDKLAKAAGADFEAPRRTAKEERPRAPGGRKVEPGRKGRAGDRPGAPKAGGKVRAERGERAAERAARHDSAGPKPKDQARREGRGARQAELKPPRRAGRGPDSADPAPVARPGGKPPSGRKQRGKPGADRRRPP